MLAAFIVEDEQHCIDRLLRLLNEFEREVQILGSAKTINDALTQLETTKPDIVFMDIELKTGTCFDLLKKIRVPSFDIIFTTAHDKYAIQAFEYSATHYLLKPVDSEKLKIAIERSKTQKTNEQLENLIHNLETHSSIDKKIAIPTAKGLLFFKIGEIIRFEADGNYCSIILSNGEKYLVTKQLKYYEELLGNRCFFRTHQSHLVHIAFVKSYMKKKSTYVKLTNGEEIPVSVRRREEFLRSLAENQQI